MVVRVMVLYEKSGYEYAFEFLKVAEVGVIEFAVVTDVEAKRLGRMSDRVSAVLANVAVLFRSISFVL